MWTLHTISSSAAFYIFGAVLLSTLAQVRSDDTSVSTYREVCFPIQEGFRDEWPFDLVAGEFPKSADAVSPIFELYTAGDDQPQYLDDNWNVTSDEIRFNPGLPTKFIIHGFGNSLNQSVWITDLRKAFQENGDYNIVLVGWDTAFPNYIQAVCNLRVVAYLTVSVIETLQKVGLELSDLHLIGHSLGAHVSSNVGRIMGSNISRITGLDPAGPWFDTFDHNAKLDSSDAQFVDVIHSNGHHLNFYGGFGLLDRSGHVDFYPNGGETQPGCVDGLGGGAETLIENFFRGAMDDMEESVLSAVGCSHGRAYEIFIESIKRDSCRFKAFSCPSYKEFERGTCRWCGKKGCNNAGLYANPDAELGKLYLQTSQNNPLCSHSIMVTIVPSEEANKLQGTITLSIKGSEGEETVELASGGSIYMWEGLPWRSVVSLKESIGDIEYAILFYKRENLFSRRKLMISKLTIEDMFTDKRYSTVSEFRMRNDVQVKLNIKEDD